jgi:hypothetical protein
MPLLRHNITANESPVEAAVLDWDDEEFPECVRECGAFDIIMYVHVYWLLDQDANCV